MLRARCKCAAIWHDSFARFIQKLAGLPWVVAFILFPSWSSSTLMMNRHNGLGCVCSIYIVNFTEIYLSNHMTYPLTKFATTWSIECYPMQLSTRDLWWHKSQKMTINFGNDMVLHWDDHWQMHFFSSICQQNIDLSGGIVDCHLKHSI